MQLHINNQHAFYLKDTLFTFALQAEAAHFFNTHRKLITGIGKANAAYQLTKTIHSQKPSLIVNLGSAGSNSFQKGEVVCCTQFIQRDMDVRGLGYQRYETPLSGIPPILNYGLEKEQLPQGICGTGDSFETNHATDAYNVVDMEAYALALIAQKENIPFLCLKYISDGADETAADDWTVQVHKAAETFADILKIR